MSLTRLEQLVRSGQFTQAMQVFEVLLQDQSATKSDLAYAYHCASVCQYRLENFHAAQDFGFRSEELARDSGDMELLGRIWVNLIAITMDCGDTTRALESEAFATDLKLASHLAHGVESAGGIVGSGWVAYVLGAPVAPVATIVGGLSVVWWWWDADRNRTIVAACETISNLEENKSRHKDDAPVMGLLYGPHGVQCLPYYSDAVTDSRGYVN